MKKFIYGLISFSPTLALAADADLSGIQRLVIQVGNIIKSIVPLLFALAVVYFFWGLAKFIKSAGDPKAQGEGKSIMIYGIIALAVMASVYGLIGWLQSSLGVTGGGTVVLPTLPPIQ
ncbi:MAG: hypothetical protein A2566_01620 [Candidatus Zambryskibacteria bacterium RIFOXYD1_FULL_40_13]|nr:MAG: hypothetical protein UT25_C0001G0025 [Parcubacteria group bacterium GW2011_GWC1_39_12]KKR19549.1 MAG: hypothetical protein UT49_C0001G0025 [Parcubacteria group bacterium GW2011_GWF1_39_37]KKR35702.1 MAG: hypothetical protein UT68_C0001G0025 [Parcubacteria group bacterium GW2011_GWC2_40_10]KKR52517.1 MAG: hypothetical protein UT89_C0001G0025 [Parcubacteria group bacterium GW2011_GWE1_40_20]KKR65408.1 MAG: hypothetical protein UU06_C0019G0003 [Parcubacteria group bacterium GW2011_GWB1_40_